MKNYVKYDQYLHWLHELKTKISLPSIEEIENELRNY